MSEKQVTVKFVTKLSKEFRVPAASLTVPANVTRYGLSTVVNHLLSLEPAKPFDFLLGDELLRQTLEAALLQKGLSTESVIELEYTFVTLPPQLDQSLPQKDWVKTLAALLDGRICSGTADGDLHLYADDGREVASCAAHSGGVDAVGRLAAPDLVLSAGKDCHACVWRVADAALTPLVRLEGHTDAVAAVASHRSACATAGWDRSIRTWDWEAAAAEADSRGPPKRRKNGGGAALDCLSAAHAEREPTATLEGHTQVVSSLAWPSEGCLFSGSWDHTLKRWDVGRGACTDTMATGKAVHCIAAAAGSPAVLAAGASDGVLRLWDTRGGDGEALALKGYRSHAGMISSISWQPDSAFVVVTGSHDCSVRMWDIRTAVPLATLECHDEKVLAVIWRDAQRLASGGADSNLHLYALRQPPAEH